MTVTAAELLAAAPHAQPHIAASLVTVTDYSDITGAATWVSSAKIAFLCRAY